MCTSVAAQQPREDAPRSVAVGHVESFTSEILGETRDLEIRLPGSHGAGPGPYPVLIVLDGGSLFRYVVSILDMISPIHLPEMIVVGRPNTDRGRDLDVLDDSLGEPGAGALQFQRFLSEELIPYLDSRYPTAPFRILLGHSLAGQYALYSLANKPETFGGYLASSPCWRSLEWQGAIREQLEGLSTEDITSRFLMLSAGGAESLEIQNTNDTDRDRTALRSGGSYGRSN